MHSLERFAYAVKGIEDLAPPVGMALQAQMMPGEVVRQIIFAPRQDQLAVRRRMVSWPSIGFLWRQTPNWVLTLTGERLLVATIPEAPNPPQVRVTPLTDLLWLELGTVLLSSWVAWTWAGAGLPQQQWVYFNTVRADLFWDMVNTVRHTTIAQTGPPPPAGERHREAFEGLPYKFWNLIPRKLMFPDEQVQVLVYQPAIWSRRSRIFQRQRAATTAVVLSPAYLLIAKEDLSTARTTYGLIARYYPRNHLRKATLERVQDDLWLDVTVGVQETEETLRLLFEPSAEPALQTLLTQV